MLMKRSAKSTIHTDIYDGDTNDNNLANILFTFNTDGGTLITYNKNWYITIVFGNKINYLEQ